MVYMYMPPRFKRPSPYASEPKSVVLPLEIRSGRNVPLTVQVLQTPTPWKRNKRTMNKCNLHVCKWYRRKRALKKLKDLQRLERNIPLRNPSDYLQQIELEKQLIEKARREKLERYRSKSPPAKTYTYDEKKYKNQAKKERKELDTRQKELKEEVKRVKQQEKREREQRRAREKELKRIEKEYSKRKNVKYKPEKLLVETTRVKKQKKYKPRKVYTEPEATAKTVYGKREIVYKEPLANRFTNCFYKFCCQLYCYLTFFIILGFVIIIIL